MIKNITNVDYLCFSNSTPILKVCMIEALKAGKFIHASKNTLKCCQI